MQAQVKIIKGIALTRKRDTIAPDDRRFLIDLRRALLQQLAVIEKRLDIVRRCRQCGHDLSKPE